MLQGIRKASEHWIGKIVLAILFTLLLSGIGIYGVEDLIRGGSSNAVATVGKTQITSEQVRQAYQNQLERYQVQLKRALTPDQARALGLDRTVMSQLITEAALDQKTQDLGLVVPDSGVLQAIREEKSFQNAQGQFDPQLFYQTLQRAGLNEHAFVRQQRAVIARIQLAEAVSGGLTVPLALREAVHRYMTERRAVAYLFLSPSDAGQIPEPTEAELKTWYDANKGRFRSPEYRSVSLLMADPDSIAKATTISDEDARKAYDANKSRYGNPEKRTIQQIVFPDAAAAEAARREIESGAKTFEQVAEARGTTGAELTLGTLTRDELFDRNVGEAAFKLAENGVSEPVQGRFGTVLLRVTKIEPGNVKPFDEVADEIRRQLALQRAKDGMDDTRDAIEDQRASAKPLAEIAADRKLPLVTVQEVDAQGMAPNGSKVGDIPDADTTLPAVFRAEIGGDNEPLRTKSGGLIWYDVTKIEAAHDKPFDEVKDGVKAGWIAAETAKRLQAKGRELVEKLDKGETIEAAAKEVGVNPQETSDLARNQAKDMLNADVTNLIFATPVGKAGSAASGDSRAVFKVTAATMPAFVADSPSDKTVTQNFQSAIADDVLSEYITDVQKNAGVKVDQAALRKVFGGDFLMSDLPDFDAFRADYEAGRPSLLEVKLVADLETPVAAFLKLRAHHAGPAFLLESVEGGAVRGRYSMVGLDPDLIWRCRDGAASLARGSDLTQFDPDDRHPLASLRALIAESAIGQDEGRELPPMAAGLFGYLGYDMVRAMERLPEPNPDPLGVPDAILLRPRVMVVFDSIRDIITVVSPVRPDASVSAKAAYEAAVSRLDRVAAALESPLPLEARIDLSTVDAPEPVSNTSPEEFAAMVARAKEYIVAGDVFQVVLSQRFEAPFALPAFALYRSLRRTNPAPFLCYLDFDAFQIVCSSPEILVRVREGTVTIRPIAGTRRRGETPAEDRALAEELLADPKERAEHLMLLDLGRNDAGRVSRIGTVRVTDQFFIERYSQVMHIVSNVEGDLDTRHDPLDALAAGFPAGTVSGAPKVRAMEIIDELERQKRGPYAGCIGYFGAGGEMDTCIVLRTAVVKDGRMHVQAGAGIVYDSDPASEQQECVNKAKALFRAAEEAVRFAAQARRGQ